MATGYFAQYTGTLRRLSGFAVVLCMVVVQGSFSTALANKAFTLSNKVGTNQLQFTSQAPLEDIEGTASEVSGAIFIDPAHPEKTTGKIDVKVGSMKTGIAKRDSHLYGEDWLGAEQYPIITFTVQSLSSVQQVKNDGGVIVFQGDAVGQFTLHGVTKDISIPVKITYLKESDKTRERAPGDLVLVQGEFVIALKDFNVRGSKGTVGSKVGETITIKANFFSSNGL